MRAPAVVLLCSLLPATGCVSGSIQAPATATITASSDFSFSWDETYNGDQDGIGAIFVADWFVEDSETGMPLEKIEVEIFTNSSGVYVVPAEALTLIDYPEAPESASDQAAVRDQCTDQDGNFDNTEEWCAWYWDTESAQYYQFGAGYADADGYAPTYMVGKTDGRGIMRTWLYVDYLPDSDGSFGNVSILGTIQVDSASLQMTVDG